MDDDRPGPMRVRSVKEEGVETSEGGRGLRGDSYLSTCLTREFFGTATTTTTTAFGGVVYGGARWCRGGSRHGWCWCWRWRELGEIVDGWVEVELKVEVEVEVGGEKVKRRDNRGWKEDGIRREEAIAVI